MLRRTPLTSPRAHSRDIRLIPLFLGTVRPWRQLDERMQRNLHPRTLLLRHIHIICVYAPQHGLMRDDNNILATLQFHDDGFQPDNDIPI